jgi:hypothetical protein
MKGLRRKQLRSQSGQALMVVALALPIFFSLALVVVDGSLGFVGKRQMQNAADAAALAAARDLKDALGTCDVPCMDAVRLKVKATVESYSAKNGGPALLNGGSGADTAQCAQPSDTNCYTWPYPSDDGGPGTRGKVEVRLRTTVGTFFTKIFSIGAGFLKPKARAVAAAAGITAQHCDFSRVEPPPVVNPDQYLPTCLKPAGPGGGGPGLAFAKSSSCFTKLNAGASDLYNAGSIFVNKGSSTYSGGMFGNGSFAVGIHDNGAGDQFDFIGAGRKGDASSLDGCYYKGLATVTATEGPWSPPRDWPIAPPNWTSCAAVKADIPSTTIFASANVPTMPSTSGVYCFDGKMNLQFTGATSPAGGIAFVGRQVIMSTANNNITGYPLNLPSCACDGRPLMFYGWGTAGNELQLSAKGTQMNGDVYAPNGQVHISGNNTVGGVQLKIFFESQLAYIDGTGATLIGSGPPLAGATPAQQGAVVTTVTGANLSIDE